jgi:hypothetical protein
LHIDKSAIAALPDICSAHQCAILLGITFTTLRMWIILEGAPATRAEGKARWTIEKKAFVEWLVLKDKLK